MLLRFIAVEHIINVVCPSRVEIGENAVQPAVGQSVKHNICESNIEA